MPGSKSSIKKAGAKSSKKGTTKAGNSKVPRVPRKKQISFRQSIMNSTPRVKRKTHSFLAQDVGSEKVNPFKVCEARPSMFRLKSGTTRCVSSDKLIEYLRATGHDISDAEVFEITNLYESELDTGAMDYESFIAVLANYRDKKKEDPLMSTAFLQLGAQDLSDSIDRSKIMNALPFLKDTLGMDITKLEHHCSKEHAGNDKMEFNEFAACMAN